MSSNHDLDKMEEIAINPRKYVTFRRDELLELLLDVCESGEHYGFRELQRKLDQLEVDDAVPIRKSDWAAHGGLYNYANELQTIADTIKEFGDPFSQQRVPGLLAISEFFAAAAEEAAHHPNRHLPTP